ncbi:phenylacetate--CoA ligase family protein [Pandoraea pulmonicola]|uniref:AMP-dependent synthetase n=1 Tax=Pandoraea pulmonicola TaxID=93221 RepID=A0AAJ4ZGI2_PANPU|nr:AMP-binding protein [Pandoraea pulmonicola]AJC22758.1 AMP-dependent synthetase [Pandoraea pulmonicola]SUA92972.1 Phenylacetate-coenzyme A ligase [Pandoraea pulmonicola]
MNDYFDTLEIRAPEAREQALLAALPAQVSHARTHAAYFAQALDAVDANEIRSRDALATLPVTRKSDLSAYQLRYPPLGGLNATPVGGLAHVYQSPGPIYEPDGRGSDWWRFARAMYAAGLRPGDLVYNTYSYHFTPAGMMIETGAARLGCCVFPAGVGQTELQLEAIRHLKPVAYAGTPSFLKILIEKGEAAGADISSIRRATLSGEALPPSLREWFNGRGITARQLYGTADLGLIAFESDAQAGLIVDENVLVELVEPGGTKPVPDGEIGEVVVTNFNPDYPLIRFATGDLSAVQPGISPCGRTNVRLKGWLGRADQTVKVRGMFVHPGQIGEIGKRYPELVRVRLRVEGRVGDDRMRLLCETSGAPPEGLAARVRETLRDVTRLRGEVDFVAAGTLPSDGKLVEDARAYD